MNPTVICPGCGHAFPVPATSAGLGVECPVCSKSLQCPEVQGPTLTARDPSPTGPPQRARSDDSYDFERLGLHVEDPQLAAILGESHNPRRKPGDATKVAWSIAIGVTAIVAVTLMKFQAERAPG